MKKFNTFLSVAVASAMVMSMAGCGNTCLLYTSGMRPGSGTGGGSRRETKCDRYCECHGLCGYGNGGDRKPDSTGSGRCV